MHKGAAAPLATEGGRTRDLSDEWMHSTHATTALASHHSSQEYRNDQLAVGGSSYGTKLESRLSMTAVDYFWEPPTSYGRVV